MQHFWSAADPHACRSNAVIWREPELVRALYDIQGLGTRPSSRHQDLRDFRTSQIRHKLSNLLTPPSPRCYDIPVLVVARWFSLSTKWSIWIQRFLRQFIFTWSFSCWNRSMIFITYWPCIFDRSYFVSNQVFLPTILGTWWVDTT